MIERLLFGFGWLLISTACDDRHVVGDPTSAAGAGPAAGGTLSAAVGNAGTQPIGTGGASLAPPASDSTAAGVHAAAGATAFGGATMNSSAPTTGGAATLGGAPSMAGTSGAGGDSVLLRSTEPVNTTSTISDADYATVIAATNDFGFELFRTVAPAENNCMLSPTSMAFALAMTYAGARNNTATQMRTVMHINVPDTTYHAGFNRLASDLAARNVAPHQTMDGEKSVKLSPVNAAWAQKDYTFVPAYLDQLSVNYDAGLRLLDFLHNPEGSRVTINQWVSEQTANKIVDLLPPDSTPPDTRLVLTNALYFYASWSAPFLTRSTSVGTFRNLAGADVTVPMMRDTRGMPYAEGENYQIADLVYDGGKLSMTIVLPAEGQFAAVRSALTDAWLTDARARMAAASSPQVRIAFPKFRFNWGTKSFKQPLQSLGMTDAFVFPTADFSGMEPRRELYIGDVYHKTFVGVDESGTEAAAATAVSMRAGGIPTSPQSFEVNRPFFFFIRDANGALLFAGQVVDPTLN